MPQSIREVFQSLYEFAGGKNESLWNTPIDWSNPNTLTEPFALIEAAQHQSQYTSMEATLALSEGIFRDLQQARQTAQSDFERHMVDLAQVCISIVPMGLGCCTGRLGITHDWILRSLSDAMPAPAEVDFEIARLARIVEIDGAVPGLDIVRTVLEWIEHTFYYCRVRNVLPDLCHEVFPFCFALVEAGMETGYLEPAAYAAAHMLNWARYNSREETDRLVALLEGLYADPRMPNHLKRHIGLVFSTAVGELTQKAPNDWAKSVLRDCRQSLIGHEELQLMVCSLSGCDEALQKRGEITDALDRYTESLHRQSISRALLRYGQERLFGVISPLLKLLIENRQCDFATDILCRWYDVQDDRRTHGVLYCTGTHPDGVVFATERSAVTYACDQVRVLPALVQVTNAFLGITVTAGNVEDFVLEAPERPGVPNYEHSRDFETAIREHYQTDRVRTHFSEELGSITAMAMIPYQQHPLQAMLLKDTGITWPMIASLQNPKPDRHIKRALIWSGGTLSAAAEVETVAALLREHGVKVEAVDGSAANKDQFVEQYSDPSYDLVWVVAHGEFDPHNPHLAGIRVHATRAEVVTLVDLENIALAGDRRRLLMLNICDGATAGTLGGLCGPGLGPMLVSSRQTVISHVWPIDQRISSAYGVLLALGLTKSTSFFEAFQYAGLRVAREKSDLLQELEGHLGSTNEVVRRLSNRDVEADNIALWGCPVFLE